jgi:DNA-binding response OmpR family regulator
VSKVRAVLRRTGKPVSQKRILRVADLTIDLDAYDVTREGISINLTPTEFGLLATLADQPGRAFNRLQLLEATQGTAYEGYERTIDAHIKNLRAKIESDPKNPKYIETVFGIGYRFARS